MADQFTTDPIAFFTGVEADRAVELLRRYEGYTGAWFDRVAAISPPGTITPADIAALTLLDVSVPRDAARKITNPNGLAPKITALLEQIKDDLSIWNNPESLTSGSGGWKLEALLRGLKGVGRTKASKLMAAKRPDLFPVYDRYVGEALFDPKETNFWAPWVRYIEDGRGDALRNAAVGAQGAAGASATVSPLRVVDIVVWMRQYGDRALQSVALGSRL